MSFWQDIRYGARTLAKEPGFTATAVITFLMIFCVQHTQSKDDRAMQAKLDELIRVMHPARHDLIGIERAERTEVEEARRAAD